MPRKPNYKFERMERDRQKAAKKAARLEAKREKAEQKKAGEEATMGDTVGPVEETETGLEQGAAED